MATVLVVEDRPIDRRFLSTLLRADGFVVHEAADASQALALLNGLMPDLVVSDVLMPTLDGFEFVRRMREMPGLEQTPVLFYTATYHAREAQDLARYCGVADVLTKPSDAAVILGRIRSLLRTGGSTPTAPPATTSFEAEHRRLVNATLRTTASDLAREKARLDALIEVARDLSIERDPRLLLERVAAAAREVTFAQFAFLASTDGRRPADVIVSGLGAARVAAMPAPSRETALVRQVMDQRRAVRQRNSGGDPSQLGFPPEYPRIHSVLVVPIATGGRVHAWMAVANKIAAEEFPESDEELVQTLAAHAAVAFENALLFEEARAHTMALEAEILERRRTEQALRDIQERTEFALSAAGIGVWDWDLDRDVITWSKSMWTVWGREPGAPPPRNETEFFDLVHADDRESLRAAADRAMADRTNLVVEFRTVGNDDKVRTLEARARVGQSLDGQPTGLYGICYDITQRRSLEEQLRQAQKMEAIGQLAGGIAHDFNNMLTAIMGYAQFIASAPNLPAELRPDLELISESGRRAAALTRQLLTFSRKQVLQPMPHDVNALLRDIQPMLRRLISEDIELTTSLQPGLPAVIADPNQVEQIVLNLVVNARDAMPRGGTLMLETALVDLDREYLADHADAAPGRFVMLAVSDTGIGMDAATRARIFDPFFTTKPAGQGTGLGLSTVYGIVKQTGGWIGVYTEPGQGSTFKVYLPLATTAAAPEFVIDDVGPVRGGTEMILVVEDERSVRQLMCAALRRAGYTVVDAETPAHALAIFQAAPEDIALLITDVVMPEMNGPALYARLAALRPTLKVLYASGYTDGSIGLNGRIEAGVALLQKPFTSDGLTRKVREVLDR